MTSLRNNYQMTSPNVCSVLTRLLKASLSLLKVKKCKKYMRHLSGTFSAFVVWLSRFFGLSYIKESGKRHYPDGKNDKNCTSITSHQWSMISKKKCCVYKARTHSLTTFGPQGFDKIVYFILFFNLKQFSLGGVIYPAKMIDRIALAID